jgi:hypothetical protein
LRFLPSKIPTLEKKKKKNREPLHIFKTQKRKRKREGILKKQRK